MLRRDDTIFAFGSGVGRAGVAVMRISGPDTGRMFERVAGPLPPPRRAVLRRLHAPSTRELIDEGLALWMPGPSSFTGEDQAELHVHGSLAVKSALVAALANEQGLRPAEPGEFTRRAFLNGRIGLAAVEGLADLIDAETELQRRQALRLADGALDRLAQDWREALLGFSAELEARLDFSDEGDVPADLGGNVGPGIGSLRLAMERQLVGASRGERLREGFTVVIAGAPNAGKSTLINALAQRDVAIVSPIPGTTRDAIEVRCDIGGIPVTFVDTAGLREHGDEIEQEGIARARHRIQSADLVLWLVSSDDVGTPLPEGDPMIVETKSDLDAPVVPGAHIRISARTGENLPALLERIAARASAMLGSDSADSLITRERQRFAISDAAAALEGAEDALYKGREELAAEDLRIAARAIGRLSGTVDVEDVLDRIFAQFCIGK